MNTPQPKTAAEALEIWRRYDEYVEDDGASPGYFEEMFGAANRAHQLANIEQVPLDKLIPDDAERAKLIGHAEEFDAMFEADARYAEMMDPPPDNDRTRREVEDDEAWPYGL